MKKRLTLSMPLAVLLTLAVMSTAFAAIDGVQDGAYDNAKATHGHDQHQHGGQEGHIDVANSGVDLVSKLRLNRVVEGKIADVGVYKDYAYLAAWGGQTCKYNGVHVVDISDVDSPTEVGFIPSKEGSYPGEGVQALSIDTPAFTGDILVTNNEMCKATSGFGGMNIYDVSDPENWTKLAEGFGDFSAGGKRKKTANEIHSVFAWDAGNKAYAVMVDNEEAADVDIVDITNPAKPKLIAEYDLAKRYPQIVQQDQGLDEVFLHDMIVKEVNGRQVMLLSYWDAGYVQLDVTDPTNVTYLSDSDFADPDTIGAERGLTKPDGTLVPPEGNGHQAEFTADDAYVVAADEDFSPFAADATNDTDDTDLAVSQGSDTTKLEPGDQLTGTTTFFGRACPGDATAGPGDPNTIDIAVVERGVCTFTEKVAAVEAVGGYDAIVIFNRTASDGCNASMGMTVEGDIPTFGVAPREQGFAIFDAAYDDAACLAGDGTQLAPIPLGAAGDTLSFSSYFDGWGYLRLLDAGSMSELDAFAVPEAHDQDYADGAGDLSVHEVAASGVDSSLLYVSYYAAGLRVIDVAGGEINEVGAFIDDAGPGNNFWGVQVFESGGKEYVAASDRDFGLYIFEADGVND